MMHPRQLAFVACLCLPSVMSAQATVTVPIQDPVYGTLDRLAGMGLITVNIVGLRPYTRREIARMVAEASAAAASRSVPDVTQRQLQRLRADYPPELRSNGGAEPDSFPAWHGRWLAQLLALDSPPRKLPDDPVAKSDALINPILNDRSGRPIQQGVNAILETEFDLHPARRLAIRARPRVLASVADPTAGARGDIQALSAATLWRNIRVEVGRQELVWGQGMSGGMVGSASGRPLDMLRVSTEAPFSLPGFLRVLGPMRGNLYFADLGGRQNFPHAALIGYKLDGHPFVRRFELAAFVMGHQLGRGSPPATFWDHAGDMIPVINYTIDESNTAQFSNKFAGWEYRLRVPEFRGLQLYLEHAFDDMDPRRWGSTFWEDAGHIAGASIAQLDAQGRLSGTIEYHHTGLRYYQHGVYTSGLTLNRTLVGDPLGNEADGGYARLLWDAGGASSLRLDYAFEKRGGDVIITTALPPNDRDFRFVVVQAFPREWRHRLGASWRRRTESRAFTLDIQLERVRNFSFVEGVARTNLLVGATLESLR